MSGIKDYVASDFECDTLSQKLTCDKILERTSRKHRSTNITKANENIHYWKGDRPDANHQHGCHNH